MSYSNVPSLVQEEEEEEEATCWALSLPGPPGEGWGKDMHKKKGKIWDSCSAPVVLDTGNPLDPAQEGTSRFPQLLLLLGVFPAPFGDSCRANPAFFTPTKPTRLTWPSTSPDWKLHG